MALCNHKRRVGGVLHSKKKTLVHNIAIVFPTVDRFGSLTLWSHLTLDNEYWKYLINGFGNPPTPLSGPPPSPDAEIPHSLSPPSPPRLSQVPPTLPPPSKRTRPSPIPSPWEAPTPPWSQTPWYDMEGVGETGIYYLDILLITGRPTER